MTVARAKDLFTMPVVTNCLHHLVCSVALQHFFSSKYLFPSLSLSLSPLFLPLYVAPISLSLSFFY